MNYKDKLQGVKTIEELFDFRNELRLDGEKYNDEWQSCGQNIESDLLRKCQEVSYFITRVERQITALEAKGYFLTSIKELNEDMANAKLTEAEPNLLKSLQDILKWSAHLPELANEDIEKAKQAINKALGNE